MIRTAEPSRGPAPQAQVSKGWVREGILSGLSTQPSTVTELSNRLGVSKSTASYHLSLLLERGVVEVVDADDGSGGTRKKRFGIKEGSFVTLLSRRDEESELGKLRETFDLQALAWERSPASMDLVQLQGLLYRMFLHLFRLSKSEHASLLREYGNRAGAFFAARIPALPPKQALLRLAAELGRSGISDADLLEVPDSTASVIVSNTCIGSSFHPSNACYFLEGIVEGAAREKLGQAVRVGRITVAGLDSCLIAVGRRKHFDKRWLAEAVLGSSSYAAINRRMKRGRD